MPRFSWSLAAALSMSAIAAFRPEVGSKSLAAHAARSFTRVVESIAQRFQSNGASDARNARSSETVDSGLTQADATPLSAFGRNDQLPNAPASAESRVEGVHLANTALSDDAASQFGVLHLEAVPPKYSSPPVVFFASLQGDGSVVGLSRREGRLVVEPQPRERHWKDCAVAAICSGIPGPVALRSTPQALGKPPSV